MFENKNKKEKNENKITESEAYKLIKEWGEDLELRLAGDDLEELQKELWRAVVSERLSYNSETEKFSYVLKKPIEKKDGSGSISMIQIQETDMQQKRDIKKMKDDIDTMVEFFKAYCRDSEGNEIQPGFLLRIKDRDQSIISAVILGFFVQVVPGKK